jgi:hypothetical protein
VEIIEREDTSFPFSSYLSSSSTSSTAIEGTF